MTGAGVTVPLVTAIEAAWGAIQSHHADVPEVVVTLGGGASRAGTKLGHFAAERWQRGEESVHELFVGGEGLKRGGRDVLGTLLHEAAHGAAKTRGIQDTSRQGRFHNQKFRAIGQEFGLTLERDSSIGWSVTSVPAPTAERYRVAIAQLDAALVAYRHADALGGGRKSSNNGVSAVCDCGRKIRMSKSVYQGAPILCGECGAAFTAEDSEESD